MAVRDHTGAALALKGPNGERYRVYVMGPSGLLTIDAGATFDPVAGAYVAEGAPNATITLTCSTAAVWFYQTVSGVTGSVAPNGSSTSLRLTLTSGSPAKPIPRTVTMTVTGTAPGGTQATFNITLRVTDNT